MVTGGDDCADGDAFSFSGRASLKVRLDCMRDEDGDGYGTSQTYQARLYLVQTVMMQMLQYIRVPQSCAMVKSILVLVVYPVMRRRRR